MARAETRTDTDLEALPASALPWLVQTASRAPSLHNSQPWRFTARDGGLELWADRSRWPRFADPSGRELHLSCGAALQTLQVAVRSLSREPVVCLLPEPGSSDLLARVGAGGARPARPSDLALLRAVHRRHTHRAGFSGRPLSASLRAALQRAAEQHGARLGLLDDPGQRAVAARITAAGARVQNARPLPQAEARRWTAAAGGREGVQAGSRTAPPPFGITSRSPATARPVGGRPDADGSVLAVITTQADRPGDWLAAGQALQSVLLTAATDWVFADIDSQALEVEQLRRQLAHDLHLTGAVQLVFALGHAPVARLTPRRPVAAVLRD